MTEEQLFAAVQWVLGWFGVCAVTEAVDDSIEVFRQEPASSCVELNIFGW
jgi:hypothetical protein